MPVLLRSSYEAINNDFATVVQHARHSQIVLILTPIWPDTCRHSVREVSASCIELLKWGLETHGSTVSSLWVKHVAR